MGRSDPADPWEARKAGGQSCASSDRRRGAYANGPVEAVKAGDQVVGRVYFRVSVLDEDAVIPELVPLVFIGRNLDADEPGLYFQDVDSYLTGERYEGATGRHLPKPARRLRLQGAVTTAAWT